MRCITKRRSRREVFYQKGVLKNFTKFTGKHLCWSLFFNKVAGLGCEALLKKRLQHRCFPENFVKFLRTLSLKNTSGGWFYTKYSFMSIFCKEKSFETNNFSTFWFSQFKYYFLYDKVRCFYQKIICLFEYLNNLFKVG